jgi:anthranilate/para-aminobenzoate synthase component II
MVKLFKASKNKIKNNKYHTVGTVQKQQIPPCWNSSKTTNTTLLEQFKNNKYHTVGTV